MTELEKAARQALEALGHASWDEEWQALAASETSRALRRALADHALDKKAENARELGLDYEPVEQQPAASHELLCVCGCTWEIKSDGSEELISSTKQPADELLRLRDLLGKANALARIRANEIKSLKASLYGLYELEKQRDELQERLIKTEGQLGEAVWNYGELKREQLANQQKTSGSPIDLLTEPADEPVVFVNADHLQGLTLGHYGSVEIYTDESEGRIPLYTRPQPAAQWVGLTDEEAQNVFSRHNCTISKDLAGILARAIKAKLKEKNNA